jgi:acyl-CoA synthetase (AMP-forming)/AMP-acid ligase II/acyl carrier protein
LIRSSSASLAPTVISDLELVFGVPVIEAYGMTEAAHQMTSNPLNGVRKLGSVGPSAGPEVAIANSDGTALGVREVGEVIIRGPNVMGGYRGIDDQSSYFSDGGWFRTGDQGYLDEDRYLFLTGRLKEIINRGGESIAPREIDEAMLGIPGIAQAVAFAVPDPSVGEEVAAAVVLEPAVDISEEELQAKLSDLLAFSKIPKLIRFVDEIPKGPTGKIQRIGLATQLRIESVHSTQGSGIESEDLIETISNTWKSVLEVESVGSDDAFLESGGDSLTATALAVAIEEEFGIDLPLLKFYNAATIRQQASLVAELLEAIDRRPEG